MEIFQTIKAKKGPVLVVGNEGIVMSKVLPNFIWTFLWERGTNLSHTLRKEGDQNEGISFRE